MKNYIIATVLAGSLIGAHAQVKQTPSHRLPHHSRSFHFRKSN